MLIDNNAITIEYRKLYSLQKKKIAIPIFQRFYDWKEKEIVQLKEDLLLNIKNPEKQLYFLDFIFYEEDNYIKIADGQQRLVTINNLIKAIRDVAIEENLEIEKIDFFDINYDIFSNQKKYYTHFYNYPTAPFKKVYLSFLDFIRKNISDINLIINCIKNNIFVYMKKCLNADNAFEIFQQINTGGKPLTKDEVIKTALDQFSLAYQIPFDTSKMKEVRQSLISYYKLKSSKFDKNFDNIEIITFLREYITKDKNTFKEFVETIQLLDIIENSPIKHVINYINRTSLFDVLNILAMKKININTNQDYLIKVVIPLCMMSIILTLNGGSPTTFRYLLNNVIEDIKNEVSVDCIMNKLIKTINEDSITWQIKLNDFTAKLEDCATPRGIKKSILILDVVRRNLSGTLNVDKINLEHIYPQNPTSEWALNGWPSHRETQKELIENIGNFILLSEEVNKRIQNQYITYKIDQYSKIISYDLLLQTPMNSVSFKEFEIEQQDYIKKRASAIAKMVQQYLPFGKVLIKN